MDSFYDFNIAVLNLWIAKGLRGLPSVIHELGYDIKSIEWTYDLPALKPFKIKPEICLVSHLKRHLLMMEFKSGKHMKEEQLTRYGQVTTAHATTISEPPRPGLLYGHDCMVVGRKEHCSTLLAGLQAAQLAFPLVGVTTSELRLEHNKCSEPDLHGVLDEGLEIAWNYVGYYMPLGADCTDKSLATEVAATIINAAVMEEARLTVRDVCTELWGEVWNILGVEDRTSLEKRVETILGVAALVMDELVAYDDGSLGFEGQLFGAEPNITIAPDYGQAKPGSQRHFFMPRQQQLANLLVSAVCEKMGTPNFENEVRKMKRNAKKYIEEASIELDLLEGFDILLPEELVEEIVLPEELEEEEDPLAGLIIDDDDDGLDYYEEDPDYDYEDHMDPPDDLDQPDDLDWSAQSLKRGGWRT